MKIIYSLEPELFREKYRPAPACGLAIDIGATHIRFRLAAFLEEAPLTLYDGHAKTGTYPLFLDDLARVCAITREQYGVQRMEGIVIGAPGRISPDRSRATLTLVDWGQETPIKEKVQAITGAETVLLLNDLEAGAAGIFNVAPGHRYKISAPETALPKSEDFDVILGMPGTGHGIGLYLAGQLTRPSEGGGRSVPLSAASPEERSILSSCSAAPFPPTFDDLVSGGGMVRIKDALLESEAFGPCKEAIDDILEKASGIDPAETLSRLAAGDTGDAAHHNVQALCRRTVETFCRLFARGMKDAALIFLPRAVFLGGIIVERNHPFIEQFFMPEFTRHPHHGPYLSALPVFYLKGELDLNLKGGLYLLRRIIRF